MTVKLVISPDAEARLREQAAAMGKDVEVFAAQLLERAVSQSTSVPGATAAVSHQQMGEFDDVRDFDAAMDELFAGDTSQLPETSLSYSRDDIYFDHD